MMASPLSSSESIRSLVRSVNRFVLIFLPLFFGDSANANDSRAVGQIFGEAIIAENVLDVRRQAAILPETERYEFLRDWVLPNDNHAGYRLSGDYLPQQLSNENALDPAFALHFTDGDDSGNVGDSRYRTLVSPVFDLVSTAKQLNRLEELKDQILRVSPTDPRQRESRLALLALVCLATGSLDEAKTAIVGLRESMEASESPALSQLWPGILVAEQFLRSGTAPAAVDDLIAYLRGVIFGPGQSAVPKQVQSQIQSLNANVWQRQWGEGKDADRTSKAFQHWIPVSHSNAEIRGLGYAASQWVLSDNGAVVHLCGSDTDYLLFNVPITGEYDLEADLSVSQAAQVLSSGQFTGRIETQIHHGVIAKSARVTRVPRRNRSLGLWTRYRSSVNQQAESVFLVGSLFQQRPLAQHEEPWIGLRSWFKSNAQFRDVRIGGSPIVPDQVLMSHSPSLAGWTSYFDLHGSHWQATPNAGEGVIIVGQKREDLPRSNCERMLRYFRPLVGDSQITFEFFYDPNVAEVAPTIDRLAFMLSPSGVTEHIVTDGAFERSQLRPDNRNVAPEYQRHSGTLPLKLKRWNSIKLDVAADQLKLFVNDQLAYERFIDGLTDRTFGLFHYADRHAVQVRNVVMKGDWHESLDGMHAFADPLPGQLDAKSSELSSVFEHSFSDAASTSRYFDFQNVKTNSQVSVNEDGVHMISTSTGGWQQVGVSPKFSIQGDFDVIASFTDARPSTEATMARIAVSLGLADDYQRKLICSLAHNDKNGLHLLGTVNLTYPDGTQRYLGARQPEESVAGRLRISRRGDQVYFLMAQGDSDLWRIVQHETASTADIDIGSIQLLVVAQKQGSTSVTWKDLTLRAESLMVLDGEQPKQKLTIFSQSSKELRDVANPTGNMTTVGSPDWAPDERFLAYDQSTGSTTNSRMMIVDVESGKPPVDVGYGSMPNFSPDGKLIAFSAAREGVGIMNRDGTERRMIDRNGWGLQWSPQQHLLAYSMGGQLYLWDLRTDTRSSVFTGDAAARYSYLFWNMCWSPDGKWIAMKARRASDGGEEIAVVELADPSRVKVILPEHQGSSDITWTSDSRSVILPMGKPSDFPQLFAFDLKDRGPQYVVGQPQARATGVDVSKTGTWIAVTVRVDPKPEPWKTETTPDDSNPPSIAK
ncbi:MAG: DUF1583 domain-containing protein [Planctomycetota bacterium]